jgi:hypothetical protein
MHLVILAALFLAGPNTTEMATGDVWSSREELVYVPREALELPDAASPADIEPATGDVWATPKSRDRLAQESGAPKIVQDQPPEQANR